MPAFDVPVTHRGLGRTARRDLWWVQPLLTFLGFSAFIVYATWAAFQGSHYSWGPYLSPFYSPEIFGDLHIRLVRVQAQLVARLASLVAGYVDPLGSGLFRFTCYYYRGAYYKAFWADPPSCAVGEPRQLIAVKQSFPLDRPKRSPLLLVPGA